MNNKSRVKELGRSSYPNSYPKEDLKREGQFVKEKPKENPSKSIVQESFKKKDENMASNRTSDIKCFKCMGHVKSQCPSMRTILMKAQDLYSSKEEITEERTSDDSDCESYENAYPYSRELLLMISSN